MAPLRKKKPLAAPPPPAAHPAEVEKHLALYTAPETGDGDRIRAMMWLSKHGIPLPELAIPPTADAPDVAPARPASASVSQGVPRPTLQLTGTEKPPPAQPKSLECETALIAGLLRDNAAIEPVLAIAGPGEFAGEVQRWIVAEIAELHGAGKPADAIHLADRIAGDTVAARLNATAALGLALDYAGPLDLDRLKAYAEMVHKKWSQRQAEEIGARIVRGARLGSVKVLEEAERDLLALCSGGEPAAQETALARWPRLASEDVFHGVSGEIIRRIADYTGADLMAVLGQFLVAFGNMAGRQPCWYHEATRHGLNLNLVIAGPTGVGGKGTSLDVAESVIEDCDQPWMKGGFRGGLISGEGMIQRVRDPLMMEQLDANGASRLVEIEKGAGDKRALFVENEFGSVLTVMMRKGSTLSEHIRKAFDGKPLDLARSKSAIGATGHHISIIGHITVEELSAKFSGVDAYNGFGNRFLWACARRARKPKHKGGILQIDWEDVRDQIRDALDFARSEPDNARGLVLVRDKDAQDLWDEVEDRLTMPRPRLFGAMTARAAPLVMRLAAIYAVLDCSPYIRTPHLKAGLAFWDYCEQSAAFIFGDSTTDPDSDRLLATLREAGDAGLSLSDIRRKVFRGHRTGEQVARLINGLVRTGLVDVEVDKSTRRPTTLCKAVNFGRASNG